MLVAGGADYGCCEEIGKMQRWTRELLWCSICDLRSLGYEKTKLRTLATLKYVYVITI